MPFVKENPGGVDKRAANKKLRLMKYLYQDAAKRQRTRRLGRIKTRATARKRPWQFCSTEIILDFLRSCHPEPTI